MNILLVDDNSYTLRALKSGIDYEALGIYGVFTAKNMKEAILCLKREEIPLVLTDIEMPNGTGLQLLEWINEHKPDTVTLFCTSYASFDYAKKAVELHSFDYYLKPIQYEDLQKILEKAVAEVCKRREARARELIQDDLASRKMHFWQDTLFWVDSYDVTELGFLAESRHLSYSVEDRFTLAILQFEKEKSRMSDFAGDLERFVIKNISEELCGNARLQIEMLLKCRSNTWAMVLSHSREQSREWISRTFHSLACGISDTIHCVVTVCFAYQSALSDARGRYRELEIFCQDSVWKRTCVIDIDEVQEIRTETEEEVQNAEKAVEKVKSYMDEHFCENITRETLSEIVYLSPGYLANSFKKEMGISLGGYLIEKRMERARALLLEDKMSVSEVAYAVGYDNFAYFSRLFKNKVGISPKEYKKEYKK